MRAHDLNAIDSVGGDSGDDVAIEHHLDDVFSGDHPVRRYPEIDHGNVFLLSHKAIGSAKPSIKQDRALSESIHINIVYDLASVRAQGSSPKRPVSNPVLVAIARSGGIKSGLRNAARLPSRSARESQAAML